MSYPEAFERRLHQVRDALHVAELEVGRLRGERLAVAVETIVEGMPPGKVAAALGVSYRRLSQLRVQGPLERRTDGSGVTVPEVSSEALMEREGPASADGTEVAEQPAGWGVLPWNQ